MALLPYANQEAASAQPQQPGNVGLLNDPMMMMVMLRRLMGGRRRGGGGNALQMMMQLQQQESQAKRQAQQDAIAQERLNMDRQQFGMQQQMYQQKLSEAQQEQVYNKQLADMITKGGQAGAETLQPPPVQNAAPYEQGQALNPANMQASNGPAMMGQMPQPTDLGERLQQSMLTPRNQEAARPQAQQIAANLPSEPEIFSRFRTDPQQQAQAEMQRRQEAATLIRAGQVKEGLARMQPQISKLDEALIPADVESVKKSREAASSATNVISGVQKFRDILDNVSDKSVGPIIGRMGTLNQVLEPDTQLLNSLGKELSAQMKNTLGLTGVLSDADLKLLEESTLNTKYDKDALYQRAEQLESLARKAIVANKFKELYLQKNGTLRGAEEEFMRLNSDLESRAKRAIENGANPKAVQERLLKMRGF